MLIFLFQDHTLVSLSWFLRRVLTLLRLMHFTHSTSFSALYSKWFCVNCLRPTSFTRSIFVDPMIGIPFSAELGLSVESHLTHSVNVCHLSSRCSHFGSFRTAGDPHRLFIFVLDKFIHLSLAFIEPLHFDLHDSKPSSDECKVDSPLSS